MKKIIVLGGGTSGWLTASILAAKYHAKTNNDIDISLVESPDIPTIGVGEGTVPTMRQTLQLIGVDESEFIRECDVTFKQSIKFVNWLHNPKEKGEHYYHHLFNTPHKPNFDLTPYWLEAKEKQSYASSVTYQEWACEQLLAPKKITHKNFQAPLEYAYHLDASKFGQFLAKHAVNHLGVNHIQATIEDVVKHTNGDIASLVTKQGDKIDGDFFVDCSGFASTLLGKTLDVKFVDKSQYLLADTAIAAQVPYQDPNKVLPPFTIATAQQAGWVWDIGLTKRKGVGYVFSSNHTNEQTAIDTLAQYIGDSKDISFRKIPMKVGYREKFWQNNCVGIGLSAGFVEPLEATALLIVEATAKLLADKLPLSGQGQEFARNSFNQISTYAWDKVIDFIKLHYYLSRRTDGQFWLDNRLDETTPDSLLEKLAYWKHNIPSQADFFSHFEVFHLENYQYVLYGMDFKMDLSQSAFNYPNRDIAQKEIEKLALHAEQLGSKLTPHRQLLEQIKQYGFSKI